MRKKENKPIKIKQLEDDCRKVIVSEEYSDLLVNYERNITATLIKYNAICYQIIDETYAILHSPLENGPSLKELELFSTPNLYGPYGVSSLDASGILTFHEQPYLTLRGQGVIIGFVDSGIDYTHPTFIYEDNTTKILSIWDQTIQEGEPPLNFEYGTEYTSDMINEALDSENPFDIVPSEDETGHGTFLAGTAAGRNVEDENFVGAAPDAEIIMVKLKGAKQYIRDIVMINEDAVVYQNTDIMMGIKFLIEKAAVYDRPLVICIGLGTNIGDHAGAMPLEVYLEKTSDVFGRVVVVAAGNEANLGHHYLGEYTEELTYQDVELRVAPNERGVTMFLWARTPDIYSIAILSPGGEFISRLSPRIGEREELQLLLEQTQLYVQYELFDIRTGDEFVIIRLEAPSEGIWTLRVYGDVVVKGEYNIWIDREGWIQPETRFLDPSPFTTVTIPSTNRVPITVGAYDHLTDSLFIGSGRGWTRYDKIKPEIVAPGVDVFGPLPNNRYGSMSGTSVSAAHVAGASALLLEWGIVLGNNEKLDTRSIKKIIIRGANRKDDLTYPNREWGYGSLNLFNSFDILRGRKS
ncbi:MAG: S8 family peptidase [Eubacteriales bacterium]